MGSVCESGGPKQAPREIVRSLGDGTHILQVRGRCLRSRYRSCRTRCLPPDTRIATPTGGERIEALQVGASVWTQDRAIQIADYTRSHTYDIRVSGDTGIYWANGVPVTSTLRARD